MTIELVSDSARLAQHILSEHRELPAVVIAQDQRNPELVIDAEKLASEIGQLATIHVITKPLANAFRSKMPEDANVYGNAVRVYEPGAFIRGQRSEFTPRPSFTPEGLQRVIDGAVKQVMRIIARKTTNNAEAPQPPQNDLSPEPLLISATVRGFTADGAQALATSDDGSLWRIDADDVIPGVRLDWILSTEMPVTGLARPAAQDLDLNGMLLRPRIGQVYRHGDTVLGLITGAGPGKIDVKLLPESVWPVKTSADDPTHTLDQVFAVGDVVPLYFTLDKGAIVVRLAPPESAALPAPPLVLGGGAWLVQGRTLIQDPLESIETEDDSMPQEVPDEAAADIAHTEPSPFDGGTPEEEPAHVPTGNTAGVDTAQENNGTTRPNRDAENGTLPMPTGAKVEKPTDNLAALSVVHRNLVRDRDQAVRDVELLRRRLTATERKLTETRKKNDELSKRLRAEQQKIQASNTAEPLFLDEESAVRFEIRSVWAAYIPAQEKNRYPEPADYLVGNNLAKTLNMVTNSQRRQKTVETIVDILVKREERARILNVHPYRTGNKATKPQLIRTDGAKMFRAYVQTGTSDGLRIHYWVTPESRIEISSVDAHNVAPS